MNLSRLFTGRVWIFSSSLVTMMVEGCQTQPTEMDSTVAHSADGDFILVIYPFGWIKKNLLLAKLHGRMVFGLCEHDWFNNSLFL